MGYGWYQRDFPKVLPQPRLTKGKKWVGLVIKSLTLPSKREESLFDDFPSDNIKIRLYKVINKIRLKYSCFAK